MPPKDKYVLSSSGQQQQHAVATASSEGLVLADFDEIVEGAASPAAAEEGVSEVGGGRHHDTCVHARLPLPRRRGPPSLLAAHPGGEWMVVGYGANNGREDAMTRPFLGTIVRYGNNDLGCIGVVKESYLLRGRLLLTFSSEW